MTTIDPSLDRSLPSPPLGARDDPARRRARERRPAIAKAVRRAVLGLGVAAAAGGVVLALRPEPVAVDVAEATRGPLVVAVNESGTTRVKDRYVLSAPVTGRVSRVTLEPGDPAKEGQPLAEIAPALSPLLDERTRAETEARLGATTSALAQARAQAARADVAKESADRDLARLTKLAAAGSVSPRELEQAAFDARMRAEEVASAVFATKVAAEEVRVARVTLGVYGGRASDRHVDVLAPVSGRVLRVQQKSAAVVQAGAPLLEIGDPEVLEVVVDLLTTDAVRVTPSTPVVVEGWGGDVPLRGRVRRVEPSAFTKPSALGVDEQRVNVVVALTDPRDRYAALGDGYRVEARIVLWQSDDVLRVPEGAVFRRGDGWAVFRVDGKVARLVPVRVGHRGDTDVEVLSGLEPGARVAVHPGDRVKDGARVSAR